MVRVTDPERSRAFYEALGMAFRRDLPIVREGSDASPSSRESTAGPPSLPRDAAADPVEEVGHLLREDQRTGAARD